MDNIIGIYCIKNNLNNKVYIGQSININHRIQEHISLLNRNCHSNSYLQRSFNKYGIENFSHEIIEECSEELLSEREIYWINYYDSYNNGYNLTEGGEGLRGYKFNNDTKSKISKSLIGIKRSEETRNKISISKSGPNHPNYHKPSNVQPFYGKTHSEGSRQKISVNHRDISGDNNPMKNRDVVMKAKETRKGYIVSNDTKIKMSESQKRIGNKPPSPKGKIHICSQDDHKLIYPNELEYYLSIGYKKGMKYS